MTDLKVTELDFDGIKNNLKLFLESQEELSDYNFTGSTMNLLLDTHAYVTHYIATYANQAINETFLDSALLRSSVVSRAKELNYVPRQYTPAKVTVAISVDVGGAYADPTFVIPKYTKFKGEKDGTTLEFRNTEEYTLTNKVGTVFSGNIVLFQGYNATENFTVTTNNQVFKLSPEKLFTDLFSVNVYAFEGASTKVAYVNADNIINLDSNSSVFFWQESLNGGVDLFFGDGVIGKKVSPGNYIEVEMFVTKGLEGNGASSFAISQSLNGVGSNSITITSTKGSLFGSDRESIESIKRLAPRLYSGQNRLVTLADYKSFVEKNYGYIDAVSVWGGQDNIPTTFGRVYLSIKPEDSDTLTNDDKESILADIAQRSVVGITADIVDPELLLVNVNTKVRYNDNIATLSSDQLKNRVKNEIIEYFDDELVDFDSELIHSKLVGFIDDIDKSIIGNITDITLSRSFIPSSGVSSYSIDFSNPITTNSVISNTWTDGIDTFYLDDNASGVIKLYRNSVFFGDVGTVNYLTGIVTLSNFNPSILENTAIVLTATPTSKDIKTLRNNLLLLNTTTVEVI